MAHDLLFGRTSRNFSRDSVGATLPLPTPDLSTKAMLEQKIKSKAPELPPELPPDKLLLERLREAAPGTMKAYDKYRPTYKDHKVVLRMKTDLLGPV
jgi:hypothetical protein